MIKVKKIVDTGAGEAGIRCYKCAKNRASFYLMRKSEGRSVDVPLCKVCLSAFLNYLDDKIIKFSYDLVHGNMEVNDDNKQ